MEMASAALERSHTPTSRVRNVLFWSYTHHQYGYIELTWETAHVHAGWVWRNVLFEWRNGTLDYDLETLIQLILALKTVLGQLDPSS